MNEQLQTPLAQSESDNTACFLGAVIGRFYWVDCGDRCWFGRCVKINKGASKEYDTVVLDSNGIDYIVLVSELNQIKK